MLLTKVGKDSKRRVINPGIDSIPRGKLMLFHPPSSCSWIVAKVD